MTWFTMMCPERIPTPTQVCNHVISLLLPFRCCFFFSLYFVLVCTCSLSCSVNNRTYTTGDNKWSCLYVTLSHLCRSRWDDLWWCGGRRGGWLQQLTGQRLELQWVWKLWREQRRRGLPGKWRAPRFHETKATSEENPCMSNSRFLIPLTENNSSYVSMLHICMGVETAGTKEGFNFLLIVKVEEVFCLLSFTYHLYWDTDSGVYTVSTTTK